MRTARRSAPAPIQGRLSHVGRRFLLALPWLVGAFALPMVGCQNLPLQKEGQTCGGAFGGCAKGLRCSFKKKKCYRPVDCKHLDRKMKACLSEVVSVYAPNLAKIPAQKRTRLLERIGQQLQTEVVDHCKYDAAAYQKKHSTTPTKTKSYGEDPRAKKIAACLHKQECRPFARCLLGLARVVGPKRPDPKGRAVFPIAPPRPAPVSGSDAGVVPAGMDAPAPAMNAPAPTMDAKTAAPAMGAKTAAPAMGVKTVAPVMRPMTARPTPRPR